MTLTKPTLFRLLCLHSTGSAITGPVAKECADLWPRIASNASTIAWDAHLIVNLPNTRPQDQNPQHCNQKLIIPMKNCKVLSSDWTYEVYKVINDYFATNFLTPSSFLYWELSVLCWNCHNISEVEPCYKEKCLTNSQDNMVVLPLSQLLYYSFLALIKQVFDVQR